MFPNIWCPRKRWHILWWFRSNISSMYPSLSGILVWAQIWCLKWTLNLSLLYRSPISHIFHSHIQVMTSTWEKYLKIFPSLLFQKLTGYERAWSVAVHSRSQNLRVYPTAFAIFKRVRLSPPYHNIAGDVGILLNRLSLQLSASIPLF